MGWLKNNNNNIMLLLLSLLLIINWNELLDRWKDFFNWDEFFNLKCSMCFCNQNDIVNGA